jgi:hypothetical protein
MHPKLQRAVGQLSSLHNIPEEMVGNVAAILLLNHYGHAVPEFDDKAIYLAEIEKNGVKLREAIARRKQLKKQAILKMMQDNIMVR